jgi:hypothetical protein
MQLIAERDTEFAERRKVYSAIECVAFYKDFHAVLPRSLVHATWHGDKEQGERVKWKERMIGSSMVVAVFVHDLSSLSAVGIYWCADKNDEGEALLLNTSEWRDVPRWTNNYTHTHTETTLGMFFEFSFLEGVSMVFTNVLGMNDRENPGDQSQGDHQSQPVVDVMAVGLPRSPGQVSLITPVDEQMPPVNHTSDPSTSSIAPIVVNPSFHSNDTDPLSALSSSSSLIKSTDTLPSSTVLSTTMTVPSGHSFQVQSNCQMNHPRSSCFLSISVLSFYSSSY